MKTFIYIFCNYMAFYYGRFAVALLVFALGCKVYAILVNACLGHGISLNTGGSYSVAFNPKGHGMRDNSFRSYNSYIDERGDVISARKEEGNKYIL